MVKIIVEGKEINMQNTEQGIIQYLESMGAVRVDPKVEGKSIEEFAADPLTIGIVVVGVGGYIWYKLTQQKAMQFKEAIHQTN